jgi:hypothetical protein
MNLLWSFDTGSAVFLSFNAEKLTWRDYDRYRSLAARCLLRHALLRMPLRLWSGCVLIVSA